MDIQPTGVMNEWHGVAIGARCQAARTFFERELLGGGEAKCETLPSSATDAETALILLGLRALRETLPSHKASASEKEKEKSFLSVASTAVAIVDAQHGARILTDDQVARYLALLEAAAPLKAATESGVTPPMGLMEVEDL